MIKRILFILCLLFILITPIQAYTLEYQITIPAHASNVLGTSWNANFPESNYTEWNTHGINYFTLEETNVKTNNASYNSGTRTEKLFKDTSTWTIYSLWTHTWTSTANSNATYRDWVHTWTRLSSNTSVASSSDIYQTAYASSWDTESIAGNVLIQTHKAASSTETAGHWMSHIVEPAFLFGDTGTGIVAGTYKFYTGSAVTTPVSSFSCAPTTQGTNTDVVCVDSSTNTPTDWYWAIDAESWGADAWITSTSRNISWKSAYPGFFSVNLRANNSAGSDWENKTNYVQIYTSTGANTLTATPDAVEVSQPVSLVATATNSTTLTYAGGMRDTLFSVNRGQLDAPFNTQTIGVYHAYNATFWQFKTTVSGAYGTPSNTLNPLTLTDYPIFNGLYTYAFTALDTNGNMINNRPTDTVTVGTTGSAGALTMNLQALDGGTMSHLSNYQMNITSLAGTVTEFGNVAYDYDISLPRGLTYTLQASKTGYQSNSKSFTVPIDPDIEGGDFGAIVSILLFNDDTFSAGNTTITVGVDDKETYYPIGGVQISIPTYTPKFTGGEGEAVSFIIPYNTTITITGTKDGYCSDSDTINTGTSDFMYRTLYLKYGACIGVTPTHTPIPNATPVTPTITPIGGYGVLNGTAATCQTTLPKNTTMVDMLKNQMACNGITDLLGQNLALAMLIMLMGGIILGRVAKGIGVMAGVIIGAVLSTAMGFLPIWIVIVIMIMAGLVFGIKIFTAPSG